MSQSRNIADFFRAPSTSSKKQNQSSPPPADSRSTSFPSPHIPPPHSQPESSPGHSAGVGNSSADKGRQDSIPASQGASFNSSQRVIKNGKVIVTSSDGDDTDSLSSLEDPDELLRRFTTSATPVTQELENEPIASPARPSKPHPKTKAAGKKKLSAAPTYKFSLESLVTDAVDDNEAEASIAKLKQALEASQDNANGGDKGQKPGIREEMLASAIGLEENDSSFQRLLEAVNRTEAFVRDPSWSFFGDKTPQQAPSPEPFPDGLVSDDPAFKALKDPASRERIIYSAFLNSSFSRNALPDEVILWILNTIPCEPRDHIRYAYCRAFDFCPQEWSSSNLRPAHIDNLFHKLGARPVALNLSESLESTNPSLDEYQLRDWRCLISVLSLLGRLAGKFANDTREHALTVLLRLTVDATLMRDCGVCLAAEDAIAALCREATNQSTDACIPGVTKTIFETIHEPEFRAQLLKHINPITPPISLVRCRLALSFFFQDPSLLDAPVDKVFDLNRISTRLEDKRFNFSRLKAQRGHEFDFGELAALTTFLDIGICSGTASLASSSSQQHSPSSSPSPSKIKAKEAEEAQFNADIDTLTSRLKTVFSSIEDSGASHLKRTETKESLQALYYRLLYSVRTKQQPKKSFFDSSGPEQWSGMEKSGAFMDRFLTSRSNQNSASKEKEEEIEVIKAEEDIPIRKHSTE